MSNSSQGIDVNRMALEGLNQVMDSMDLVKRAWSGFNLATPFTPTLDVAELDKRIGDLRAVEQWLSLNQNMLRSTIQGLEIQRGTLHAFSSVAETFGQAAAPPQDGSFAQTFARFAAAAAQRSVASPGRAEPAGRTEPVSPPGGFDWSPLAMPSAAAFSPVAAGPAAAEPPSMSAAPSAEDPGTGNAAPAAGVDPLGWWQMLQENFRQIAQAATAPAATADDDAPAASGAARRPAGARKGAKGGKGGKARNPAKKTASRRGKAGPAGDEK